jgi:hypothetical protein
LSIFWRGLDRALREQKQHEVALGLDLGSQLFDFGLTLLHAVVSAGATGGLQLRRLCETLPIEIELRACRMSTFA